MGGAGAPEQASDRVGGLCAPPLPSSLPPCPALQMLFPAPDCLPAPAAGGGAGASVLTEYDLGGAHRSDLGERPTRPPYSEAVRFTQLLILRTHMVA